MLAALAQQYAIAIGPRGQATGSARKSPNMLVADLIYCKKNTAGD